jgi:hypothetical protein
VLDNNRQYCAQEFLVCRFLWRFSADHRLRLLFYTLSSSELGASALPLRI